MGPTVSIDEAEQILRNRYPDLPEPDQAIPGLVAAVAVARLAGDLYAIEHRTRTVPPITRAHLAAATTLVSAAGRGLEHSEYLVTQRQRALGTPWQTIADLHGDHASGRAASTRFGRLHRRLDTTQGHNEGAAPPPQSTAPHPRPARGEQVNDPTPQGPVPTTVQDGHIPLNPGHGIAQRETVGHTDPDCAFCDLVLHGGSEQTRLSYFPRANVLAFTPLNPAAQGHTLFIPAEHVEAAQARTEVLVRVMAHAWDYARTLHRMGLDCNVFINCGPTAGQTQPHLHVHVLPRRAGDGLSGPWLPCGQGR